MSVPVFNPVSEVPSAPRSGDAAKTPTPLARGVRAEGNTEPEKREASVRRQLAIAENIMDEYAEALRELAR